MEMYAKLFGVIAMVILGAIVAVAIEWLLRSKR